VWRLAFVAVFVLAFVVGLESLAWVDRRGRGLEVGPVPLGLKVLYGGLWGLAWGLNIVCLVAVRALMWVERLVKGKE